MLQEKLPHQDRSRPIRLLGGLMLSVGIFAAFLGPLEIYTFSLFSEGGRFHYAGFGFGSFMFVNITVQVIGYYLIAAIAIPLGYAHLKIRRWARKLMLGLLYDWLVLGLPLSIIFFLMLLTAKDLPQWTLPILALAFLVIYPLLPLLLTSFYRSFAVKKTFEDHDPGSNWVEETPQAVLVIAGLTILFAFLLHIPTLFNGLFPLFGTFLSGISGMILLDLSILCLALLSWGLIRRKRWAWLGSVVYFALLTSSSTITLSIAQVSDIFAQLRFAPLEMELLRNVPLQGYHLAIFIGAPTLATWIIILFSRRYFLPRSETK
jgi:hypothetical protein